MERRRDAMLSAEAFGVLEERLESGAGQAASLSSAMRRTMQAARRDMLRTITKRATRPFRRS
jgi:hypothetical protein